MQPAERYTWKRFWEESRVGLLGYLALAGIGLAIYLVLLAGVALEPVFERYPFHCFVVIASIVGGVVKHRRRQKGPI